MRSPTCRSPPSASPRPSTSVLPRSAASPPALLRSSKRLVVRLRRGIHVGSPAFSRGHRTGSGVSWFCVSEVFMRVLLVDLPARDGIVSKDTVVGGYGSRLVPFTRVTAFIGALKRRLHDVPSVQLAYLAGVLSQYGHDVIWSRGEMPDADVAIVLSSLVDYRHETAWADEARARGIYTGFVGLTASKLPELFRGHADFVILGEPEAAI